MDKIKQNKNYCVVYKSFAVIMAVMIIISIMCSYSFATYQDEVLILAKGTPEALKSAGNLVRNNNQFLSTGSTEDSYAFCVIEDSSLALYFTSTEYNAQCYKYNYISSIDTITSQQSSFCNVEITVDGETWYYARSQTGFAGDIDGVDNPANEVMIPRFSSIEEGIHFIIDDIAQSATSPHKISYDLPAGNVMFIDIAGVENNETIPSTDKLVKISTTTGKPMNVDYMGVTCNQAIGYLDSIPSNFSLPINGTSYITFWNGYGSKTIGGKYQHWVTVSNPASHNGSIVAIVNPTIAGWDETSTGQFNAYDNPSATNGYMHIETYGNSFKVVSLSASYQYSNGVGSIENESSDTSFTGVYDDTTNSWITTNEETGEIGQPSIGGTNDIDVQSESETIFDYLKTIASSIGSFFTGAVGAVQTLVGAGSAFFQAISGLYAWLPVSIMSVISSALIIVITVGVVKVFL